MMACFSVASFITRGSIVANPNTYLNVFQFSKLQCFYKSLIFKTEFSNFFGNEIFEEFFKTSFFSEIIFVESQPYFQCKKSIKRVIKHM